MSEEFFDIDPNRLDDAWLNHSGLYHEHALKLADARADYERLKTERDVVAAELDKEIRSNPALFGLEKVTEAVVGNTILLQKLWRQANGNVIEGKHQLDILQAAVDTLDHRKKALENLVQLRLSDYWSEPRAKGESRDAMKTTERDNAFGRKRSKK